MRNYRRDRQARHMDRQALIRIVHRLICPKRDVPEMLAVLDQLTTANLLVIRDHVMERIRIAERGYLQPSEDVELSTAEQGEIDAE